MMRWLLPAGELHWLRCGELEVAFAAGAGGRVAHLRYQGVEWLVDAQQAGPAAIVRGCYPMVPWAGRIRRGQFHFDGRPHRLPLNFDGTPSMGGFLATLADRPLGRGGSPVVAGAAERRLLAFRWRCRAGPAVAGSQPADGPLGPGPARRC